MNIVTSIFGVLTNVITQAVAMIGGLFDGVAELFYTPGVGEAAGELTFIGSLSLIGVGLGLFWLGFGFVKSLIKTRG